MNPNPTGHRFSLRSLARRPRHATVVAYIALAMALAAPAAAATLHVRSADIVNGQVKRVDIGDNAVTGGKVDNNSLTGKDVKEGSLVVTRISNHIRGNLTVSAPQTGSNPYPLNHSRYRQPAGSSELYFGTMKVSFPAGCDPQATTGGSRSASVEVFVNGKSAGSGFLSDQGTNAATRSGPILVVGGGFATATTTTRNVTAQVSGFCEPTTSSSQPNVISVKLDVARFR
jgi:hypothetical protein